MLLLSCLLPLCAFAADEFKQLSAAEIRSRVVGRVVTDEAHWSDHFRADGTIGSIDLGETVPARWRLQGNELCTTRRYKTGSETGCVEVWMSGDKVEYRRDGVTVTWGVLRNP
jgi:hypothetical protein